MLRLDDAFLEDVGLAALPRDERQLFLNHVFSSLEEQVGKCLTAGLTGHQLSEFESFIDQDSESVKAYLDRVEPEWRTEHADAPLGWLAERAASHWLEQNRPDHKELVASVFQALKATVRASAADILAAVNYEGDERS